MLKSSVNYLQSKMKTLGGVINLAMSLLLKEDAVYLLISTTRRKGEPILYVTNFGPEDAILVMKDLAKTLISEKLPTGDNKCQLH